MCISECCSPGLDMCPRLRLCKYIVVEVVRRATLLYDSIRTHTRFTSGKRKRDGGSGSRQSALPATPSLTRRLTCCFGLVCVLVGACWVQGEGERSGGVNEARLAFIGGDWEGWRGGRGGRGRGGGARMRRERRGGNEGEGGRERGTAGDER